MRSKTNNFSDKELEFLRSYVQRVFKIAVSKNLKVVWLPDGNVLRMNSDDQFVGFCVGYRAGEKE